MHDEAFQAFSSATMIEPSLACAWAAWGEHYHRLYKDAPKKDEKDIIKHAADAMSCYLHAASLYNNAKSRKYLARILWLLSLDDDGGDDDGEQAISKAYEAFKNETPIWYWITFIPQLLNSLGGREGRHSRNILLKLAKSHPQV
jgi:transformation/transcription domain-associated protein